MTLYFLSYDLRNARHYQPLYDELDSLNAIRILDSTWCFKRNNTDTESLRDHFSKLIDADDGLIISKVTSWASLRTDGTPKDI